MQQFLHLVNEMSPYLLLGFLLAGLLHAFVPGRLYARYLSQGRFSSVFYAALFGIPLTLCSCGVIPTAMSLRREGASKGAVVSFLIATPQTGVDSILATYGLMGLPFAIVRPLAALCTALVGGGATLLFDGHQAGNASTTGERPLRGSFLQRLVEALRYGYVIMMQDIGRWLILGLAVAALITICVPAEWFAVFRGNTLASMLMVIVIAVPMYVCATGSIPIAVALMMKGLTPGAALVLLMAGPACNVASILVVRKVLGWRTLGVYLASIVTGAVSFGCLIDYLQFHGIVGFVDRLIMTDTCCLPPDSMLSWGSTALLLVLLVVASIRPHINNNNNQSITIHQMKTYHIEGMSCNHCRMSAEKAILAVEGVTTANVDLQKKAAYVEGTAPAAAIIHAVGEVGFTCTEA